MMMDLGSSRTRASATVLCALCLAAATVPEGRAATPPQNAPRRVALVIGIDAYPKTPLRNAVNDANAMALVLRDVGFQVTRLVDVDFARFERAVAAFSAQLEPDDVALFYFSGHGVQVDNENYLMPVDFSGVEQDVKYRAVSASRVHDHLTKARVRFLILDACRNNPFGTARGLSRAGLAAMEYATARGSLIAFATGTGQTADDNVREKNGLFTKHLLHELAQSGVPAHEVFRRVRTRVSAATAERQVPWVWESLRGDFAFRPGAPGGTPTGDAALQAEMAVWEAIKDSSVPAPFEQYLREFPSGRFRSAAHARLDALRRRDGSGSTAGSPAGRRMALATSDREFVVEFQKHASSLAAAGLELTAGTDRGTPSFVLTVSSLRKEPRGSQCRVVFDLTLAAGDGRVLLQSRYEDIGSGPNQSVACTQALMTAVYPAVAAIVEATRKE